MNNREKEFYQWAFIEFGRLFLFVAYIALLVFAVYKILN